jgi:hypothetical protein
MIFLNAPVFDYYGDLAIREKTSSGDGDINRRSNRIATLDGGAVLNDRGQTASDKSIAVVWSPTRDDQLSVERMVKAYPFLIVSTQFGCFYANPQSLTFDKKTGDASLRLLVMQQLNEAI